jgi:flavin reductase (DIM6/NTAB) family NADH-FMN oxidoreductase RutF/DNA-binding IclR family transcriptional regulator
MSGPPSRTEFGAIAGPPHDPGWFRNVLGQYPTGVCVVTGVDSERRPAGLVVGSFTSVSLNPPLVSFLPAKSSTSWPKIARSGSFCVNVLAHDQEPICRRFATKEGNKFAGVAWRAGGTGSPIIERVVAWADCRIETVQEAGDHLIVVGRVLELAIERWTEPLLFFRGGYGRFAPLSFALASVGLGRELQLVDRARTHMEKVADDLEAECFAWALVGDEFVLLATAGAPEQRRAPASMVGTRLPLVPPAGSTWMAYAEEARVVDWLNRAPIAERDEHRERLAQVRRRGYSVALGSGELARLEWLLERGMTPEIDRVVRALPLDPPNFVPAQADRVAMVDVPAFDENGQVVLILGVRGFRRLRNATELERLVTRLRQATFAVTGAAAPEGVSV